MVAITQKMYLKIILLVLVVSCGGAAFASEAQQFPLFRHVDKAALASTANLPTTLSLLVDEDFAPFSFKSADGKLAGVSVQLALAVCAELKVQCQLQSMPYANLLSALQEKRGDLVIGGPPASPRFGSTRPYYFSSSQFFVRGGSNFGGVDTKSLAGRRLGFVKGTNQDAFLKKNFDRATLIPFTTEAVLFEALRTGGLDLAFVDSLRGAFWSKGQTSRGCCVPFGGAFVDKSTISHGLVMLTRSGEDALREALDAALDRLQEKGITAKAFATYLPSSPF